MQSPMPMFQPSILWGILTIAICGFAVFYLNRWFKVRQESTENLQMSLVGLRGFLATGVYLHHFALTFFLHSIGVWAAPNSRFYSLLGSVGVSLFFMMTGFLFWRKLLSKEGRVDWAYLYISSVFRIVPLYWFAVGLVVLIVLWAGGPQLQVPLRNFLRQVGYWVSFANYPDINKYKSTYSIVAGVLWTLKYEWLFYFSLPVLAVFIIFNQKIPGLLWVIAAAILWLGYQPVYINSLLVDSKYLVYFLVGAVAASLETNKTAVSHAVRPLFSVVALISIFLSFALFNDEYLFRQAFFLALFFIPIALGNSLFGVLTLAPFKILGDVSYSVYVLHGIVLYVLFTLLFPSAITLQTGNGVLFHILMTITGVAVVSLSWVTYTLVERPFMGLGRRMTSWRMNKR